MKILVSKRSPGSPVFADLSVTTIPQESYYDYLKSVCQPLFFTSAFPSTSQAPGYMVRLFNDADEPTDEFCTFIKPPTDTLLEPDLIGAAYPLVYEPEPPENYFLRVQKLEARVHKILNADVSEFRLMGAPVAPNLAEEFRATQIKSISRELGILREALLGVYCVTKNRRNYVVGQVANPELITPEDKLFKSEFSMLRYILEHRSNYALWLAAKYYIKYHSK